MSVPYKEIEGKSRSTAYNAAKMQAGKGAGM